MGDNPNCGPPCEHTEYSGLCFHMRRKPEGSRKLIIRYLPKTCTHNCYYAKPKYLVMGYLDLLGKGKVPRPGA